LVKAKGNRFPEVLARHGKKQWTRPAFRKKGEKSLDGLQLSVKGPMKKEGKIRKNKKKNFF